MCARCVSAPERRATPVRWWAWLGSPAKRRGWPGTAVCVSGVRWCAAVSGGSGTVCVQSVCDASPQGGHEVSSDVGGGPLEELRNKHTKIHYIHGTF